MRKVVWNTKCDLNKESIFCDRNFVTDYTNNEIPRALVFNALIPTGVYFLSIPVVGNPILASDAKYYLNTESMSDSSNLFSSI